MKKLTTLVFAALIALTLSMPAWSQATTSGSNQTKTAKQDSKQDKKEAKAKKQAKKKADKDTKKDAKKK